MCTTWREMMAQVFFTFSPSGEIIFQQLRGRADRRQRIAQLVRQHRKEFVLALVCQPDLVLPQARAQGPAHRAHQRRHMDGALEQRAVSQSIIRRESRASRSRAWS
jgi:hypothetical protein